MASTVVPSIPFSKTRSTAATSMRKAVLAPALSEGVVWLAFVVMIIRI
jgi:hypothetical protein